VEAEILQHARNSALRIVGCNLKDAVLQCVLLELALSFLLDFTFEVGIWRSE
jgi:hypothetical protein